MPFELATLARRSSSAALAAQCVIALPEAAAGALAPCQVSDGEHCSTNVATIRAKVNNARWSLKMKQILMRSILKIKRSGHEGSPELRRV